MLLVVSREALKHYRRIDRYYTTGPPLSNTAQLLVTTRSYLLLHAPEVEQAWDVLEATYPQLTELRDSCRGVPPPEGGPKGGKDAPEDFVE